MHPPGLPGGKSGQLHTAAAAEWTGGLCGDAGQSFAVFQHVTKSEYYTCAELANCNLSIGPDVRHLSWTGLG